MRYHALTPGMMLLHLPTLRASPQYHSTLVMVRNQGHTFRFHDQDAWNLMCLHHGSSGGAADTKASRAVAGSGAGGDGSAAGGSGSAVRADPSSSLGCSSAALAGPEPTGWVAIDFKWNVQVGPVTQYVH